MLDKAVSLSKSILGVDQGLSTPAGGGFPL